MNKRAEKNQEQLARNAAAVNAIDAAAALLAKIEAAIQAQTTIVAGLEGELQLLALQVADGQLPAGDKSALDKLAQLEAAKTALQLASAALPAAQARLEQARIDARKNALAANIATVNKFGRRRIETADRITTAIEALDAAFVEFHEASRALSASYAGVLPPSCLTGSDIATAVSAELFRIAPRDYLGGGQRERPPLLPGAMQNRLNPSRTLREAVELANRYLVEVLEKGTRPGSEGSEEGKVPIGDFALPADNRSAAFFGQKIDRGHPGNALSDASLSKSEGPLREGQVSQDQFIFPADAQPRITGEFSRPQRQEGMVFPDPVSPDDWQKEKF